MRGQRGAPHVIAAARESFLRADEHLAAIVRAHQAGTAGREQCLLALLDQQQTYHIYVEELIGGIGRLEDER
ncbi:MAG TPA: hypothetical protein VJS92_15445 [Candidatus Polarisedimenticolaceae bacterium]|nr:hypothetical protein [Candidatus Polarisedimenticolaceae bacterium]